MTAASALCPAQCHTILDTWLVYAAGCNESGPEELNALITDAIKGSCEALELVKSISFCKLHLGSYDQVHEFWRNLFSTVSLIEAMTLRSRGSVGKAIEVVDKALMFGAELFRNELLSIADDHDDASFSEHRRKRLKSGVRVLFEV
jgi:hypothetical protein